MKEVIEACHYLLFNCHQAQATKQYLDSRLSEESQKKFELGYFPDSKNLSLLISLVGEEVLKNNKLIFQQPNNGFYSFFENHSLIIPLYSHYNELVSITGRSLLSDQERAIKKIEKYKNTVYKKTFYLFGLSHAYKHILEKNFCYLVEGQFDALKAFEKGINNVVAVGSSSLSSYQLTILLRYTNNIFVLLDNDEAGKLGSKRIIEKYNKYANIKTLSLPTGYKDLDEFLTHHSVEDLSFVVG